MALETLVRKLGAPKSPRKRHSARVRSSGRPGVTLCNCRLSSRLAYYRAMAEIGVGMLGYAFMGKAHSNAFRKVEYMAWPPPLRPRLVAVAGLQEHAVEEAGRRYGYGRWTTDWRDLVS